MFIVSLVLFSVNNSTVILLYSKRVVQLVPLTTRVSNKRDSYRNIFEQKMGDHISNKSEASKPFCGLKNLDWFLHWYYECRDSSVGIATRYGLDDPGIESRWGRDFPHPSRQALGPAQPPTQSVPGLSWGLSGRGVALTTQPHLARRLKEE